jgi:hypothetical protein
MPQVEYACELGPLGLLWPSTRPGVVFELKAPALYGCAIMGDGRLPVAVGELQLQLWRLPRASVWKMSLRAALALAMGKQLWLE